MNSVALLARKGGAGKTTLAIHMGVLAQADGLRVVFLDLDPQRSLTTWWQSREPETPALFKEADAKSLRGLLRAARRQLLAVVRDDQVCRRLMTVPGIGPVAALAYRTAIDVPARFSKSKGVGAAFGLAPTQHQSGEVDRKGGISKRGDESTRALLYEAAQVMMTRTTKWNWLKVWAVQLAKRSGFKRAVVALARRLAVVLHRMWIDGTEFRWTREVTAAA